MRKGQATLPLAFALALAAEAGAVPPPELSDHSQPLRAGVLSSLDQTASELGAATDSTVRHRSGIRDRVAQFFPNFKNCFSGSWRNC
jgi:hypothetical protein